MWYPACMEEGEKEDVPAMNKGEMTILKLRLI
jgi:hypothetical protein